MEFPIYVVGDGYVFYNVFNAIAMIFNNSGFWNSVYLLGGLSMLVGILFKGVQTAGGQSNSGAFSATAPLYFAAIVALVGIRSTVILQDIYSGQVYKVDNVPIVVSAPASMFTTAGYKVFTYFDTVWTLPNATTSLSVSSKGFLNPLKLLLVLRSGIRQGVDPFTDKTLEEYVTYCADGYDGSAAAKVSNVALLQFLQTNATQGMITNIYNSANPNGVVGTCRQAADYLVNYFQAQIGDPNTSSYLASILNLRMKEKNPADVTGKGAWVGIDGAGSLLGIGTTSSQSAQTFAMNALTFNTMTLAFNCRNQRVFEAAMANCVTNLALADTLETWKTTETFSATFFTNMALGTQTFFQLLFFAFSPLILILMLFMGSAGFQLYWKYIVFGAWTSTFLPLMAVIQGITMYGLYFRAQSSIGTSGLTLESWGPMYHALSDWLTYGSAMMAAVPGLAWGLVSGSVTAMVPVINRLNGAGHANPEKVAPSAISQGPMFSTQPAAAFNGASGITKSASAADIKIGTSNKVSQVDSQVLQNSISQAWGKNWQAGRTETDSAGTKFTSTTDGIEYTKKDGTTGKLSNKEAAEISAGGGLKVMGNGVSMDVKTGRQYDQEQSKAFDMSQRIGWNTGAEAGHSTSLTGSLTESEQRSIAAQMTTATQKARTQESTVSQTYDLNALKSIRDIDPKAYDRKIMDQQMKMEAGVNGVAFSQALEKANQDLSGYRMDPDAKLAMIRTIALANTQDGGVDISGLIKPDANGVNQSTPHVNLGSAVSSRAQAAAKVSVESGALELKNQSNSERSKLEPSSGAMAVGVVADGARNVAGAAFNAATLGAAQSKESNLAHGLDQAKIGNATQPAAMNYGPDGSPVGPTTGGGAAPIPEQNRIQPVKSGQAVPAPGMTSSSSGKPDTSSVNQSGPSTNLGATKPIDKR